jgi:hypothetical protein
MGEIARGMVALENLSDPFLAKCSECGHNASYPKSAMRPYVPKN